jgi:hypothetical protein
MAEDKVEPREVNWRQLMPWTTLFQGFRVALDPNKLVLAAAGILLMALGWWVLSIVFDYKKPSLDNTGVLADFPGDTDTAKKAARWQRFRSERDKWLVMHRAAGPAPELPVSDKYRADYAYDPGDLADTPAEYDQLQDMTAPGKPDVVIAGAPAPSAVMTRSEVQQFIKSSTQTPGVSATDAKAWIIQRRIVPPAGAMRTLPWDEDRGPNPFLLVTGQAGTQWDQGHFWDWLFFKQLPVLLEPLVKLFSPVIYFFNPHAGPLVRFYCLLVMLWTLLVWGLFGGAITRIATVQVARQEKIGLTEALRFSARKYLSYLSAPIFPLVLVGLLLVLMVIFGYLYMIPVFGDVVMAGLLWVLMLLIGLAMAVVLIGLVGWPLMAATISAEGNDAWEAVSRSYSYVYQAPWHYIWYTLVALAYGVVLVFFVGLMGSLTVYLSKWGVSQTPGINWANRNPTYLFVYAPESFDWRRLLLQDDSLHLVNSEGQIDVAALAAYKSAFHPWNYIGAVLVSIVWVGIIFMLVLGFGYSYFWSASSIIYLLMRRKVDDMELDEVYLEEEDESALPGPLTPKPSAAPAAPTTPAAPRSSGLPIVEPPRPTATAVAPPAPPPAAVPAAPEERKEIAGAIHAAPGTPPPPGQEGAGPSQNNNPPAGT